jgi:hypothetical protein
MKRMPRYMIKYSKMTEFRTLSSVGAKITNPITLEMRSLLEKEPRDRCHLK